MDSVVCAYMFSHMMAAARQRLPRLTTGKSPLPPPAPWLAPFRDHTCIPVCNFPRAELALRQDIALAFARCQIDLNLCFADELPLLSDASAVRDLHPQDCVILVDHNVPTHSQAHLAPLVRAVIDHHALPPTPLVEAWQAVAAGPGSSGADSADAAVLNVVEKVGSAASLVARLFRALQLPLDPLQARLLLAPVLLDTSNFSEAANKAVEADFAARAFLTGVISAYGGGPFTADDGKAFWKELSDARESYDDLSIALALRKDSKTFTFDLKKAVSTTAANDNNNKATLVLPIASWGENLLVQVLRRFTIAQLLADLEAYAEDRGGDGAMAMFHKKGQRHVVYVARTPLCCAALASFFSSCPGVGFTNLSSTTLPAECAAASTPSAPPKCGVYQFDDPTFSRKQLSPKLSEFFLTFSNAVVDAQPTPSNL